MEPVTAALLLAVATGASEAVSGKAWEGLSSLVHRWFKRGEGGDGDAVDSLNRLRRDNGAADAAERLARALAERAETNAAFRAELTAWQASAGPVYLPSTVITGGTQGTVLTAGRVDNLTIQAPGQPLPARPPEDRPAPRQDGFALNAEDAVPAPAGLLIQIREAAVHLPLPPPKSLAGLPMRASGFSGREDELHALMRALDPAADDGGPSVVAAVGPPGVGKTTLAVEAGHAAKEAGRFPGGVLFLNLHGYDEASLKPAEVVSSALRALGVAAEHIPDASMDQATSLYRSMLAELAGPVLVLADNASSAAQVRPLLPGAGGHRVLVTSRLTMPELGGRLFQLLPMAEAKAVTMLDAALRVRDPLDRRIADHPGEAARLARSCGCLPLALDIAGRVLASRASLTVAELAADLADRRTRIDRLDELSRRDGTDRGVMAAFEVSYEQLAPACARLLRLCAASPGPDLATDAVAALAGDGRSPAVAVLDELDRAHLIMPGAGRSRWQIHDLLREYVERVAEREAGADGREEAYERLLGYYLDRAERATGALLSTGDTASASGAFATWRDAAQWFETERLNLLAAATLAAETGLTRITYQLSACLTDLAMIQHYPDHAETLARICLDAARLQGEDSVEMAVALTNLAHIDQQSDRNGEAIAAFSEAVRILRNLRDAGEELPPLLATALAGLGGSLLESGQPDTAIATLEEALAEARANGTLFEEVQALIRLATALARTRQYDAAIATQRQAVAAATSTGNAFHRGMVYYGLGAVLSVAGRHNEAVTATQQATDSFREAGFVWWESTSQNAIGDVLWSAGKRKKSLAAHRRAAELMRQSGNVSAEGSALTELADALRKASRREEALPVYQEAIELFAAVGDRGGEARACQRLGWTLRGLKRYTEAVTAFDRAIDVFGAAGDRSGEANALIAKGSALRETGQLLEAVRCHQRAVGIHRAASDRKGRADAITALGKDLAKFRHLDVGSLLPADGDPREAGLALVNIADALIDLGRAAEAVSSAERAAAMARALGDQEAQGKALNIKGRGLYGLKRFEEAASTHRQDLSLSRETGDDRGAGIAHGNIGYALNAMGRGDDSIAEWREAAAIFETIHEPEDLGWALDGLGDALLGLRRYEEAAAVYQRAIDTLRSTSDRKVEASAMVGLAFTWYWRRDYGQAADGFGRAVKLAEEAGEWTARDRLRGFRIVARARYRWQRLRRGNLDLRSSAE